MCEGLAQYPAFAPSSSEVAVGVSVSLYLVVQNLPHLRVHAVIFSPLSFLCISLLEEMFVSVQALQQRVPGLSLSRVDTHTEGPQRGPADGAARARGAAGFVLQSSPCVSLTSRPEALPALPLLQALYASLSMGRVGNG